MIMVNRCKPCGKPIFLSQRVKVVGKRGRLQHLRCRTKQTWASKLISFFRKAA